MIQRAKNQQTGDLRHMYVLTAHAMAEEIVTHGQGLAPQGVNIMLVVNALGQVPQ